VPCIFAFTSLLRLTVSPMDWHILWSALDFLLLIGILIPPAYLKWRQRKYSKSVELRPPKWVQRTPLMLYSLAWVSIDCYKTYKFLTEFSSLPLLSAPFLFVIICKSFTTRYKMLTAPCVIETQWKIGFRLPHHSFQHHPIRSHDCVLRSSLYLVLQFAKGMVVRRGSDCNLGRCINCTS